MLYSVPPNRQLDFTFIIRKIPPLNLPGIQGVYYLNSI